MVWFLTGWLTGVIMCVMALAWLNRRFKKRAKGEGKSGLNSVAETMENIVTVIKGDSNAN